MGSRIRRRRGQDRPIFRLERRRDSSPAHWHRIRPYATAGVRGRGRKPGASAGQEGSSVSHLTSRTWWCGVRPMARLPRAVLASVAIVALYLAASANGRPTQGQFQRCSGSVVGAPWTAAFPGSIGPVQGNRYNVWIGSFGPPCTLAKSHAARLSGLRTALALRRASFGGLKCRITPLAWMSPRFLSVRPRTALGGCWTEINAPAGRYFFWRPRR
jgi:hypothetical protein